MRPRHQLPGKISPPVGVYVVCLLTCEHRCCPAPRRSPALRRINCRANWVTWGPPLAYRLAMCAPGCVNAPHSYACLTRRCARSFARLSASSSAVRWCRTRCSRYWAWCSAWSCQDSWLLCTSHCYSWDIDRQVAWRGAREHLYPCACGDALAPRQPQHRAPTWSPEAAGIGQRRLDGGHPLMLLGSVLRCRGRLTHQVARALQQTERQLNIARPLPALRRIPRHLQPQRPLRVGLHRRLEQTLDLLRQCAHA